jgi:hypothetical protein
MLLMRHAKTDPDTVIGKAVEISGIGFWTFFRS